MPAASGPARGALIRAHLAGILGFLALSAQAMAIFAPFVPDEIQFFATIARMLDSLGPHLLAASLAPAAALAAIGYRRAAAGLAALALVGGLWLIADYARMRAPAGQAADLTILWFNLLHENPTPPETLARALAGSGADVILLGEAGPLEPALGRLAESYPYRAGCGAACSTLVLSRRPVDRAEVLGFAPVSPSRLVHVRLAATQGAPALDLLAVHLLKPWYLGFTRNQDERLDWILRRYKGALVVAGDFNAAPWSRRMRRLHDVHGLDLPLRPVPTWPGQAGVFGIPIDHVLVRGGPRITALAPWGAGLGSNHRGLIARIELP